MLKVLVEEIEIDDDQVELQNTGFGFIRFDVRDLSVGGIKFSLPQMTSQQARNLSEALERMAHYAENN